MLGTALKHARGRRVTAVYLRVGQLRQVVGDSLEFYFAFVARGSLCEGARLELEQVDALLGCRECGWEWGVQVPAFRCPSCGGSAVEVAEGDEFEVDSIEVEIETEEAECIARA